MTRQGQIWMARVDGTSSRVVHDGGKVRYLRWSPKPDMLAYVAGGELWAMTPQAEHPLLLASKPSCEGCGVEEMLWSPDGEWIAYQYQKRREIRGEQDWSWESTILKVNATGGDPVEVIRFPIPQYSKEDDGHRPGNSMLTRWVGPRVLFWQCEVMSVSIMADGCPLHVLDPDGGQLMLPVTLLYEDYVAPSPDKKLLAITEGSLREAWWKKSISVVDLESGESKSVTESGTSSFSPFWSPDGEYLTYVSGPMPQTLSDPMEERSDVVGTLANRRIWIMRKDGSEKRQLTHDEGFRDERPIWLPDGEHILFARIDSRDELSDGGNVSLRLMRVDGGSPRLIADGLSPHADSDDFPNYYGHVAWEELFDYSKGTEGATLSHWLLTAAALIVPILTILVVLWLKGRG